MVLMTLSKLRILAPDAQGRCSGIYLSPAGERNWRETMWGVMGLLAKMWLKCRDCSLGLVAASCRHVCIALQTADCMLETLCFVQVAELQL